MSTPEMETYEDRYRSMGYLFYSIAACDRSIILAEIEALKEMTARHWLVEDRSYDELGIESARYIDIAFDRAGRLYAISGSIRTLRGRTNCAIHSASMDG
ncbi:MAG: hypothetical protein IPH53_07450 [Flavobacteriales bacterium]|nr:hypothetical protein [Flavobacteriales bacterium]